MELKGSALQYCQTENSNERVPVIVVAAGSSSRMNGVNKQFILLGNIPVIIRTLMAFENSNYISRIIVVTKESDISSIKELCENYEISKLSDIVVGGATRSESVLSGFSCLTESEDKVLITDGARPFVTNSVIENVINGLNSADCSLAAIKVNDTVKKADGSACVTSTVDRKDLYLAQTPQGVLVKKYLSAIKEIGSKEFTDDASVMEFAGYSVVVCEGDRKNIKITEPCDISIANAYLGSEKFMRIGHGYDVHRLVEDRKLIIGGVDIPYEKGLLGHSDADVLLHAVCDSLLGAAALGDIGKHFPDTDEKYKGVNSLVLLKNVGELLKENKFYVNNIDATVIAQAPKMSPYIDIMRENIAKALCIDVNLVSVKATTEEKLGFTGRQEGISAHSVCTVSSLS